MEENILMHDILIADGITRIIWNNPTNVWKQQFIDGHIKCCD